MDASAVKKMELRKFKLGQVYWTFTRSLLVFSPVELEYVDLQGCIFQLPPLFKGFKRLHTLHLRFFCTLGKNIGDLVASCLNLEKLILSKFVSTAGINIHSTKLKILTISGLFNNLNLHTLCLISSVINIQTDTKDALKARYNCNVSQFVASLSVVENIALLGQFFEFLALEFLSCNLPKLFNWLTEITLEIDLGNLKEAKFAICLFQNAPNLRRSELKGCHSSGCAFLGINKSSDAPMLQKVQIRGKGELDREAIKNLLKMRRSTKDAEIVVL